MELDLKGTIGRTKLIRKVWHLQFLETGSEQIYLSSEQARAYNGKKKEKF